MVAKAIMPRPIKAGMAGSGTATYFSDISIEVVTLNAP